MAKKRISNYVFYPGVSSDSNAYPNAYSLLKANKTFITKEASAYLASRVVADTAQNVYPNAVALLTANKQFILDEISAWTADQTSSAGIGTTFYGYVYGSTEIVKCKRDMGYLIDALIYDVRYGGNEQVRSVASQYYQGGVIQLINIPVELAIQTQLWTLIKNFVLLRNTYSSQQSPVTSTQTISGSPSESGALTHVTELSTVASNVISGGLSTLPTVVYSNYNFAAYTYDTSKCERDVGHVLDAYANDLRYGGNFQTRLISSKYWYGEVPQIVGDRKTEIITHQFIRDLINHTVFFGSTNTAKCERDIGYILDGVRYDIALGTNYNSLFLGLAEYNSTDISDTVITAIQNTKTAVAALPEVSSSTTAITRSNAFFTQVLNIVQNGSAGANVASFSSPTNATVSQIAASDKLAANKAFIQAEVNAWVANTYPSATHDATKCSRDIGYAIDALCYDVMYGGNSATFDQAKFFFYGFANNAPGIDPTHKTVTVAAYQYFKSIVDNIVQGQLITATTVGSNPNTLLQVTSGNNASAGDATVCQNLVQITSSVINAGSLAAATAYLATVTKVYPDISWADSALVTAKTAIETAKASIVTSVATYTPLQNLYPRQLLGGIEGENGSDTVITTLSSVVTNVIQGGLGNLPQLENGVTTIKLQGQYTLDKLLLITNSSNNQFLYNFSDPALGAIATFSSTYNSNNKYEDEQFPQFLQTADYVTTIVLKADTSTASPDDDIQIFVEAEEQKVRLNDFGTDAIERMRVAQPQSMLDADFEYGLQPTKWQAIGIARGYPSVYELPGSDTAVISVTTDASITTGGIGESIITVTTASPHSFIVGTPITIRSLANTISGFNRAEGTFIVISVPSATTFTYYATSKVGTVPGQILATTYTQLRKGAFYTGASIGQPTLSVFSNGQQGSFASKFSTPVGSNLIAVQGGMPPLGAPVTAVGINPGTQITGTVGTGGLVTTTTVGTPANIGSTSISVTSTTGILEGLAIDNGTGGALFVTSIEGNTLNLSGPITTTRAGNVQTYLNVAGANIPPTGAGADFSVDRVSGLYSNLQVTTPGSGYVANSRLKILGSTLGGLDTVNDLTFKIVSTIDGKLETFNIAGSAVNGHEIVTFTASGSPVYKKVASITSSGTATGAAAIYSAVAATPFSTTNGVNGFTSVGTAAGATPATFLHVLQSSTTGSGTGARFNVTNNGDSTYSVTLSRPGDTHQVNDNITILGSLIGGVDGVNDIVITVLTVQTIVASTGVSATFDVDNLGSGAYIVTVAAGGTGYNNNEILIIDGALVGGASITNDIFVTITSTTTFSGATDVPQSSTTGTGAGATFNISLNLLNQYEVALLNSGHDYAISDQITILGSLVGGVDGVNDLTVLVDSVGSLDVATGISQDASSGTGSGATFNVSLDGIGGYVVTLVSKGTNYNINDTITILGSHVGGIDVTNDLVLTATSVTDGTINSVLLQGGISVSGERSYTSIAQSSSTGSGTGATFNIETSGGVYLVTLVDAGQTYVLNEQLVINGSLLNGVDGVNDLIIDVTSAAAVGGAIQTFNTSGIPATTDYTFVGLTGSIITSGSGASFDITRSLGSYLTPAVNLVGSGYDVNDVIEIVGANLGGVNTTNDATIIVTGIDINGGVTSASISGTATLGSSIGLWSVVSINDPTVSTLSDSSVIITSPIATIQASWSTNHGLVPGMSLLVDITSTGTNHAYAKGPFFVESVPSPTTIRYTARTSGTLDTNTPLTGIVYARPESFFIHRPFDGGVQLGTGGPQHGSQAIRMSKKYIRYQSGKGVMYTTGALFAPSYNLQAATAAGTTVGSIIQFTTDDVDHGLQTGGRIRISGVETAGFNGEYEVVGIVTERIFLVRATSNLGSLYGSITTNAQVSILQWHGATVRAGTFDDQNGMFWQYNGRELCVGRRSSTFQLSGVSSIAKDTNLVTGTNTRYRDQLKAGDKIVIKGMTHTVAHVMSQTSLSVTPDYRGASDCVNSKVCLVQEILIPQSQFNLDRLDGTGPSGYNLDITKMQMIGMQWSWYGAGFIDFMLRGSDGNYVFAHRIRNSNVNTEAYMRTGNMPVRYEVHNEGALGKLRESISATATTIPLVDASAFPNENGCVYIDNEIIAFTGKSGNTLTGCTRAAPLPLFVAGSTRSFTAGTATTHEVNTGVILISNTITPIISHWGSAFLTDGRFDEDRGYIFNYASTGIQASTTKQTAFLIRLAPSVSNAIVGDLGDRELINRAQLLLQEIAVSSDSGTGGLVVEGVLNPQNYPVDPTAITWSALNSSSAGGQPSFAQIAPGGSVSWSGGATTTTSTATTTTSLNGTASVPNNALFTSPSGSNTIYVGKTSWDNLGASVGFAVDATESRFPNGTTVSSVVENPSPIATTLGLVTGAATIPPSTYFKTAAGSNILYFTQASWAALNATIGTGVYSTDFPAGTTVSNIAGPAVAAGQSYYTITLSQNSLVRHQPVRSNLAVNYVNVTNNVVTLYFSAAQTYAPYLAGETLTVSTSYGTVNGSRVVTTCTTTYVQFSQTTTNVNTTFISGSVVNTSTLNTCTFFVTGQATSGTSSLNFTQASWAALPIATAVVGNTVNDTGKFAAGTTISSISTLKTFNGVNYYTVTFNSTLVTSQAVSSPVTFNFTPYYTVTLSKNSTSSVAFNTTVAFTPAIIGANTSFLYFTKASWETLVSTYSAGNGTVVADPTKFPSGTSVQSISTVQTFAGTQYYRVNFTQSSITSITGGTAVTFQFGQPPYAQPGETVFSFIAAPGSTSNLDLSKLKELTNTTLGGRGTYPNGPDVLAINVYKTSGSPIPTNIIIRWGEAQA